MCIVFFNGVLEFEGSEKDTWLFLRSKKHEGFSMSSFEVFEHESEGRYDWYVDNGSPVEAEDLEYATA